MNKTVLITGGSGFLGRHLAIKMKHEGYNVILGSRNNKNNKYAQDITGCKAIALDVTNIESIRDAIIEFNPSIVIHGAATKYVDLAEKYPMECVDVNVIGSQNVIRACIDKVDMVIGISTDKAANPMKNIYGMSKSMMEKLFSAVDGKTKTKFACVRYGNVVWSTGSVFPIWKNIINQNKQPILTGDKNMCRFFFSINEAVDLVMTAIDDIDLIKGKILSIEMKSLEMSKILDIWCDMKNTSWIQGESRVGDRLDECLVDEFEKPFTEEIKINGIIHYILSNIPVDNPIDHCVTTQSVPRLTVNEVKGLILNEPKY